MLQRKPAHFTCKLKAHESFEGTARNDQQLTALTWTGILGASIWYANSFSDCSLF